MFSRGKDSVPLVGLREAGRLLRMASQAIRPN